MKIEGPPQRHRPNAIPCIVAALASAFAPVQLAQGAPTLCLDQSGGAFEFCITGGAAGGPWLLQHSPDGRRWRDLMFMDAGGATSPRVEIPSGILDDPEADLGLFRAIQLQADDPLRRRLLSERAKWRLGGKDDHDFELQQQAGQISWRGEVVVRGGELDSFTTFQQWPPGFEPHVPTIEELFGRIENAIANDAETIDVTWDPTCGFPVACFIDLSVELADEEQSWTIEKFNGVALRRTGGN